MYFAVLSLNLKTIIGVESSFVRYKPHAPETVGRTKEFLCNKHMHFDVLRLNKKTIFGLESSL